MNFIITLVLLLLILTLIVGIHEFGHFIAAKKCKVYVDEFSIGMGPLIKQVKPKKSETAYSVRALPIGGYVSMAEKEDPKGKIKKNRILENKGFFEQFWVFINGIAFNFLLAIVIFFVIGLIRGREIDNTKIYSIEKDYPAEQIGLEIGDEILEVNGNKVSSYYDFAVEVSVKEEKEIYSFKVKKTDGQIFTYKIAPKIEKDGESETKIFGIGFKNEYKKGFFNAVIYGFEGTWDTAKKVVSTLAMLIKREISLDNVSGPVGMYSIVDSIKTSGFVNVIYIIAYLSVNVAIVNLIPIPVFDGGRILIIIIEKIIRRKTSEKLEIALNYIGFALMILLMLFVTYNDIARLVVG